SPTSSPPLPPAPSQAKNIGAAAPHHFQTELVSPEATAAAMASKSLPQANGDGSGRLTPTRTRSNKGVPSASVAKQGVAAPHTTQAPPALANGQDLIHSTSLQKRSSLRRLIAQGLVLYLGYTLFFVCPSLPDSKTNLVCDSIATVQDWLHPYAEPVAEKVGETYKTYAEPYVDQYGRPIYAQGQKYYVDVAEPAFKTASAKAKGAYHRFAHPHVNKAYETVYTPKIKAHVNRAQTALNGYQKQVQDQLVYARKLSQDANDNVWRLHAAHVQPVVDKMTPHAKGAWNKASIGAARAYNTVSDFYFKHVNPYAQPCYAVILDAAENARESLAFHTDEIWGTKWSKKHKKSKAARAADRAADRAQQAKASVEKAARDAAKKFKNEPEPETLKDTLLKKAADAQRLAEEYAENSIKAAVLGGAGEAKKAADKAGDKAARDAMDAKAAATEKGYDAQKKAEEFIENARDAAAKKAQDAQKAASDEAEYLKKMTDDRVHEAGKFSERIKKTVIEKAREAQEAVARQAENLRHAAQEQVEHVQEAGAHFRDSVVGATHGAKEAVDKETEYVADVTSKKKKQLEKLAMEQAAAAKLAAQQKEKEARKSADQAAHKVQETYDAAADQANEIKAKVGKTAYDADQAIRKQADEATHQAQKAFDYVEEQTEEASAQAAKAAKKAKKAARKQAKELKKAAEQAAHDGQEYLNVPVEAAANAKDFVVQHAKDASDQATEATVNAKDSVVQHAKDASDQAAEATANAKDFVVQHAKDASDQAAEAKEAAKQKVLNAHTASKASLAAMIAGIEASFGNFYDYEDTETKNLWSKLQSAIDEHVEGAKKSAQNLEKANREAYESFESYVRDWRNQGGGDLEDRLSKLKQQSVESVKNIGQRAESDQTAAKSKVKVLANNVDVYLNGLKDFLADRLEAAKETIASDLSVFKDTSSKDDEETVRGKLAQLEAAAKTRLDSAGKDAHAKAQQLLNQVDEIWSKSEAQSRELAEKAQELALKASEDAKLTIQNAVGGGGDKDKGKKATVEEVEDTEAPGSLKSKIQSVKDAAANRVQEASGKIDEILHDRKEADDAEASNVRVANEEPGSGHRHHRH
ncbi:hypothetical protein BGW39_011750, partial [Mortierella sp. 14UC]